MSKDDQTKAFLSQYADEVAARAQSLREIIFASLPDVIEQLDLKAKMVGYCYGQKYSELICVIIPSKKGLKLGFNRGVSLSDTNGLLQGTGKISRYVDIKSQDQINSPDLKALLTQALLLYREVAATKKIKK